MNLVLISSYTGCASRRKFEIFNFHGSYKGKKLNAVHVDMCGFQLSPGVVYLLLLKEVKINGKILVSNLIKYKPISEVYF